MSDQRNGGIAWTDETWNPIRGCSKVSAGCAHCYAETMASRFSGPGMPYHGIAEGGRWTGDVRLVTERLADPLRWRKPRRIFVNSMSDLFHESLSDEQIASVFGVMAAAPRHTFQVLTKRPERMPAWFDWMKRHADELGTGPLGVLTSYAQHHCEHRSLRRFESMCSQPWPLHNVHIGVSCEDQRTADARIPLLLETPAAVRFVSYEPALGPVDWAGDNGGNDWLGDHTDRDEDGIDWVVVGGESGPKARPCHVEWIRSTVDQCRAAGVACFVKQDYGTKSGLYGRIPDDIWRLKEFPNAS